MNYSSSDPYIQGFMQCLASESKGVFVRHLFVDINDGYLSDAIAFSHLTYIFSKLNEEGFTHHTLVEEEGYYWLSLTHADWWAACRLNKNTIKTILRRIADRGFIHILRAQVGPNGTVKAIIRPDYEKIAKALKAHRDGSKRSTPQIETITPPDRFDLPPQIETITPPDRNDLPPRSKRSNPPYIKSLLEEIEVKDLDPERGREDFFVSDQQQELLLSEPETAQGETNLTVKKSKKSTGKQENFQEEECSAAPKISPAGAQRAVSAPDRPTKYVTINPDLFARFRSIYAGYSETVSATGFGSEAAVKAAWANLERSGWTPDDAFWQGLTAEVEGGMARFKAGGCVSLSAIAGGALWLNDRRWERALARKSMHAAMAEVGLAQVQPVSKAAELARAKEIQKVVMAEIRAEQAAKELAQASNLRLEKAHGF